MELWTCVIVVASKGYQDQSENKVNQVLPDHRENLVFLANQVDRPAKRDPPVHLDPLATAFTVSIQTKTVCHKHQRM